MYVTYFIIVQPSLTGLRYKDAMITVHHVPTEEHHFQLAVTKMYSNRDPPSIWKDKDQSELCATWWTSWHLTCTLDDKEMVFLIGEELEFRIDGQTYLWRDLNGYNSDDFEFTATGAKESAKNLFETDMYHAMFERKYKQSAIYANDSDLAEFIWQ
jgi:hypothetical protein